MAKPREKKRGLKAEITGIVFLALAALSGLSLVFFHIGSTGSVGLVGNNVSWLLFVTIGYSAYVFPVLFFIIGFEFTFREGFKARFSIPISLVLLVVACSGMLVLITGEDSTGGVVGTLATKNLNLYLGPAGSFVVLAAVFLISLRVGTGISLIKLAERTFSGSLVVGARAVEAGRSTISYIRRTKKAAEVAREARAEKKARKESEKQQQRKRKSPTIVTPKEARPKKKETVWRAPGEVRVFKPGRNLPSARYRAS